MTPAPKRRWYDGVMSEHGEKPYWLRRPFRLQIIILMLLGLGPFLTGAIIAIVLPIVQALRQP